MKPPVQASRDACGIAGFRYLVHRNAIPGGGKEAVQNRFRENGWLNNWFNAGIYEYAHVHSTTYECLGCVAGWVNLAIFGEGGETLRLEAGDILLMPAGVSHEMVGHSLTMY